MLSVTRFTKKQTCRAHHLRFGVFIFDWSQLKVSILLWDIFTVRNSTYFSNLLLWFHNVNLFYLSWTQLGYFSANAFSIGQHMLLQNLNIKYQSCAWSCSCVAQTKWLFEQAGCFHRSWIWRSQHSDLLSDPRAVLHLISYDAQSQGWRRQQHVLKKNEIVLWSTVLAGNGFSVLFLWQHDTNKWRHEWSINSVSSLANYLLRRVGYSLKWLNIFFK